MPLYNDAQMEVIYQINELIPAFKEGLDTLHVVFVRENKPLDLTKIPLIKITHAMLDMAGKEFDQLFKEAEKFLAEKDKKSLANLENYRESVKKNVNFTKKKLGRVCATQVSEAMYECPKLRDTMGGMGEFGLLGWELLHLHADGVYDYSVGARLDYKEKKKQKEKERKARREAKREAKRAPKKKTDAEKDGDIKEEEDVEFDPTTAAAYVKTALAEDMEKEGH